MIKQLSRIEIQLNRVMIIIIETLKLTTLSWLPVISNIYSPHIRQYTLRRKWNKYLNTLNLPINDDIQNLPTMRLKSRKSGYPGNTSTSYTIKKHWKQEWNKEIPCNYEQVE